jgi:hypothetical protein
MTRIEPLVTITKRTHHARTRLPWLLCALVIRAWNRCIDKRAATFPFEMSAGWWIFNYRAEICGSSKPKLN